LTARLFRLVAGGAGEARDGKEALALGVLYARQRLVDASEAAWERALDLANRRPYRSQAIRSEALRRLAVSARRGGRFERAAARWQELLALADSPDRVVCEALRALAIHHEHRARD